MTTIDCVTWNVHRGIGEDGRFDPERIVRVLADEVLGDRPHILALQEADSNDHPFAGFLDIAAVAAGSGLVYAHDDTTMRWGDASSGFHGLILFLDPAFAVEFGAVVDLPGHCHRGAVVVEAERNGVPVRIVTTHLSRLQILRLAQMRTLGQFLARRPPMQTVLLGDLNDWRYWHGTAFHPDVVGTRLRGPRRATFPVARPLLPLDRIMTDAPGAVEAVRVLDGPGIRVASDHRPLWGRVRLGSQEP